MFRLYLYCCALVGEGTAEESRYDVHQAISNVILERGIGVFAIMSRSRNESHVDDEWFFEQRPHVIRRINFFHLDFRVDVTVIEKIDVSLFHLNKR